MQMIGLVPREQLNIMENGERGMGNGEWRMENSELTTTRKAHQALPDPVVKRDEPLIRPTTVPETVGDAELGVNNVVFICGAYFHDGFLWLPYAGADSLVLAGRIPLAEIEPYAAT
jgi:hypothetical protein